MLFLVYVIILVFMKAQDTDQNRLGIVTNCDNSDQITIGRVDISLPDLTGIFLRNWEIKARPTYFLTAGLICMLLKILKTQHLEIRSCYIAELRTTS